MHVEISLSLTKIRIFCNLKCTSFNYFSSNRINPVTKIGIRGRGEKLRIAATITISVVKQKGQLHILSGVVRSLVMILNPEGIKKKVGKIHFVIIIQIFLYCFSLLKTAKAVTEFFLSFSF